MGEISGRIADYTIITSDNPRTENPDEIVNEIEKGIKKTNGKYECILAGKGHEPYQEINHKTYPFDERVIVRELIEEMGK